MTVHYWRNLRGLTQPALAEPAKISVDMIARIEGGSREPSNAVRRRLAKALHVPEGVLVAGGGYLELLEHMGASLLRVRPRVWHARTDTLAAVGKSPAAAVLALHEKWIQQ